MKTPSLIIRVSHLILFQIIFIFAAVALLFFWPKDRVSITEEWSAKSEGILNSADELSLMLAKKVDYESLDLQSAKEINDYLDRTRIITCADLLSRNPKTGKKRLIQLGVTPEDKSNPDKQIYLQFYQPLLSHLAESDLPYITLISKDKESVTYIIKPKYLPDDALLILAAKNDFRLVSQNDNAYLLLLLFLTSALISLLIINLIYRGIKRPLNVLLEGFEKVILGEKYEVPESGDRQIKKVVVAFNEMSQILVENQEELRSANHKLVKINKNLAESEAILTSLVDYSPDAIIVTDLNDKVIIYNNEAAKDFCFSNGEMLGKLITDFIPNTWELNTVINDENYSYDPREVICCNSKGEKFPALLVKTSLGLEGHRPMAILYFVKNITESANYQAMILKLDRIASKGKMARSIAHEINNYLAILQGNLELVPMYIENNNLEKLDSKVGIMRETVSRIANFTEGLSRFSDENSAFEKEDLNQVIENLIAFLKPQNKFDLILFKTELAKDLSLVEIDSGQIQLLLVNLINNAAEAQVDSSIDKWIKIYTKYDSSANEVLIGVSDGGSGVADEYVESLFVKRFSAKRGNGLGLMTSKNIIDNHKGKILYRKNDQSQSIFEIKIPVNRASESEQDESFPAGHQFQPNN